VTDGGATLARYRLQRAFEAFEDAATLERGERWNGAVNRLYDAAFYAAKALLATREIDAARHSAAISLFQLHFVKPGTIATDLARVLPRAFEKRQNADYGDYAEATAEDVTALRDLVEAFVSACARAVEDALARKSEPGP
jgi:uncharacterized protein (UPF0332 family)